MPSVNAWLRALPLAAALIAFPLSTSPARAQSSATAGPTLSAASVGARRVTPENSLDSREAAAAPFQVRGGRGQSAALMVVGGIAFVAGILVGGGAGAVMMVGGAAAGLYGLYLFLQ